MPKAELSDSEDDEDEDGDEWVFMETEADIFTSRIKPICFLISHHDDEFIYLQCSQSNLVADDTNLLSCFLWILTSKLKIKTPVTHIL